MYHVSTDLTELALADERIAIIGRLASMPQREAQQLARQHGAAVVRDPQEATMLIVGEEDLPIADEHEELFPDSVRDAAEHGRVDILSETDFLERVGMLEGEHHVRRLYTSAMLADLIEVPVALVRRWHRRGLIVPARQVHRLAYFDFQEVANARRLAELLANGVSPQQIENKLSDLARLLPRVERPLAQLPIIVEGHDLLLREGEELVDTDGQKRLDFQASDKSDSDGEESPVALSLDATQRLRAAEPSAMCSQMIDLDAMHEMALVMEDEGRLDEAAEVYRTVLVAAGPNAETCFHLAEVLARMGDLSAARERYSMAVELDEEFVEARCNLGCVLADLEDLPLAAAALEGSIAVHSDYPDAHYHLAQVLDELGRPDEAIEHWQYFLALAPDSPWADEARQRLTESVE